MSTTAIATDFSEDLIAKPAVLRFTTFSDTTLWRRVKAGDFPAPVQISPGRVAWRRRDVSDWLQNRTSKAMPR